MKKHERITIKDLFGSKLDFRVQLYNIHAAAGIIISLITGVFGAIIGAGIVNFIFCMITMAISFALLFYSYTSGRYQLCYTISVVCIFLIMFPALFFSAGGYHSGMPSFFIFAVLFTVFMLEGKKMIFMTIIELAVYISICIFAYFNPEIIISFKNETEVLTDTILGFSVVSIVLGVTMALHFRLYNRRQRELEAARRQVEEYAKIKSKLFAGMSHEMRTPLTVMSAYAQFAVEQIKESLSAGQPWANEKILADLATISDEAKRLAEMADGTLKILMAVSEPDEIILQKSIPVDMENLITRLAGLLEPVASRKGKKLTVVTGENIPLISGDADALAQLVWNILQNAITHSDGKNVTLTVSNFENAVKVTTADDGSGIEPKILPHIFEPGVSGKKGGSGIGLSICRDIVKRHNGEINIKSNKEEGTIVTLQMRGIK